MTLILSRQDTEGLIDLPKAIEVMSDMMLEEVDGDTFHMPPFGGGKSKRKSFRLVGGGMYGIGRMGIRLGAVHLLDIESGRMLALVGGSATSLRIPAMMALGAKYLSRPESKRIGLLGSGRNALGILGALKLVRPIERVDSYSPNTEHREALAAKASAQLEIPVVPHDTPEAAIA